MTNRTHFVSLCNMTNGWFEDFFCEMLRDKVNFCHIYLVSERVRLCSVGLKILYRKENVTQLCLNGLESARCLCPWNFPGKNTGVGSYSLFQGIFLTQGLNPIPLHCSQILYHLSHQGNLCVGNKQCEVLRMVLLCTCAKGYPSQ